MCFWLCFFFYLFLNFVYLGEYKSESDFFNIVWVIITRAKNQLKTRHHHHHSNNNTNSTQINRFCAIKIGWRIQFRPLSFTNYCCCFEIARIFFFLSWSTKISLTKSHPITYTPTHKESIWMSISEREKIETNTNTKIKSCLLFTHW